jgi:hypothetical protein
MRNWMRGREKEEKNGEREGKMIQSSSPRGRPMSTSFMCLNNSSGSIDWIYGP